VKFCETRCAITVVFVIALAAPTIAGKKSGANNSPRSSKSRPDQVEAATRLQIFDGDKLVAAYPVTIGAAQTASPIGDWKVQRIVKLPRFRWDPAMLKHGTRSSHFHIYRRDRTVRSESSGLRSTKKESACTAPANPRPSGARSATAVFA
jgi:hypothetical protein